jgi:hypothetical protein
MKDYMYTDAPLHLIATKREALSVVYRGIYGSTKRRHKEALYWLPIWIGEYDKAIKKLQEEDDDGS